MIFQEKSRPVCNISTERRIFLMKAARCAKVAGIRRREVRFILMTTAPELSNAGGWGRDGKYRYLKADGTMAVNEWIIDYGMIYYVGEDGKKFTGSQTIDGVAYQFDEDGVLVSGLIGLQYISG